MKDSKTKVLLGDKDIQQLIGKLLRYGVLTAGVITFIGGVFYLYQKGQGIPNYTEFTGETLDYTTLSGILRGITTFNATEIIQFGVVVLIATPILRVLFSLFAFILEKDKLYILITLIVLSILTFSMLGNLAG